MLRSHTASILAASLLVSCAGAAQPAPTPKSSGAVDVKYTDDERARMGVCSGLTQVAWNAARAKKNGEPKEKVLAAFRRVEGSAKLREFRDQLVAEAVTQVYEEDFDNNPWKSCVAFFKQCAAGLAEVREERVGYGAYCAQNSLIAGIAHDMKDAGVSREKAHEPFEAFKSQTPLKIVDRVYASSGGRSEATVGEWTSCIEVSAE